VRPALAALGMGILVWSLRGANLALVVAAGMASYTALLFLLRAFTPDELRLMRGVLGELIPGGGARGARSRT